MAALVVPVALELAAFVGFGFGLHARYFAIALVPLFFIGAQGLLIVIEAIAARLPLAQPKRRTLVLVALTTAVMVSALPLVSYYSLPKQDFRGAIKLLEEKAPEDRLAVGIQSASRALEYYGVEHTRVETEAELIALVTASHSVWLVTTLEGLVGVEDAALLKHIHAHYREVGVFPGTLGDGEVRLYSR